MARVVIFGTGDIARLTLFYFSSDSDHEVVGFTVDECYRKADTFNGLPLIDFERVTESFPPEAFKMFIAVSYRQMNRLRAAKYLQAKQLGYDLVSYVSTRCSFLGHRQAGDNCFILEDNTIQPFARIGNNVTLWSGNHIGHDSVVEDHCFVSSHVVISGNVRIKPYCFLGVNATITNGITIAPETLIGAGAVITQDTIQKGVYAPAKSQILKKSSDMIDL